MSSSSDTPWIVDGIAFLVGLGLGLASIGFSERFYRTFDPTPLTWRLVWGALLVSLAVGPSLPSGIARWVVLRTVRRWRLGEYDADWSHAVPEKDPSLSWTVLAALSLVTGLALAGLPLIIRAAEAVYGSLLREFLWTSTPLTLLEGAVVFACTLVPFALAGCALSGIHGLTGTAGRWSVRPLGWLLLGAALAGTVTVFDVQDWLPPVLLIVMGSAPFFVVAILAVRRSDTHAAGDAEVDRPPPEPPTEADVWPTVARAAVACITAAGVCGMAVWARVLSIMGAYASAGSAGGYVLLLGATAVGVLTGCRLAARRRFSVGGLGIASAAAGLAVAAGSALTALACADVAHATRPGWLFWLRVAGCAGVPWAVLGGAIAYGHHTVLARSGSQTRTGVSVLSLSFAGTAVAIVAVLPFLVRAVGTYASLAAVALTLVAVGGVLIIHEPADPGRTRRNRVIAVFAVVVLMSVTLPAPAGGWLLTRPGPRARLLESDWLTQSVWLRQGQSVVLAEPPARQSVAPDVFRDAMLDAPLLDAARLPSDARVILIGQSVPSQIVHTGVILPRDTHFPFDAGAATANDNREQGGQTGTRSTMAGTRMLRTHPDQFDIVVVSLHDLADHIRTRLRRTGTLRRARECLAPDGIVIALLPVASTEADELRHWIDRTDVLTRSEFVWTCFPDPAGPTLALVFGAEGAWRERWARWSRHPARDPQKLRMIVGRQP